MYGMMPGQNPFLDQFLKHRKQLAVKSAMETAPKAGGKPVQGLNTLPAHSMDLATICSSKPKPKVVREYFEQRISELAE